MRSRTPATGYNTPTAHFRNRRCLARCRRRLGCTSRAQARGRSLLHHVPNRRPRFPTSTPPPEPSAHPSGFSIRSQQSSIGFNPTTFKTPVRTSVATEFNSGEHVYNTIKPPSPSIRITRQIGRETFCTHKTPTSPCAKFQKIGQTIFLENGFVSRPYALWGQTPHGYRLSV